MAESRRAGLTGHFGSLIYRPARRLLLGVGWLAGLVGGLAGTSSHAQTLTKAFAEAYETNPQLLAQRALLRATDEQVPQAVSFWRPAVNFTGQVGLSTNSLQKACNPPAFDPQTGSAAIPSEPADLSRRAD